jgi:hypothetical protein
MQTHSGDAWAEGGSLFFAQSGVLRKMAAAPQATGYASREEQMGKRKRG